MPISFRRVSAGVLFGSLLFVAFMFASFAASAAAATAVVEVVPAPVNWVRPAAGSPYAGVQTITRSFAGNDPIFKPVVQKIGGSLLTKASRAISNPWVWGAMTAADWAWDAAQEQWGKSQNNQCFKRADNDDPKIYCELDSFKAQMAEIYTRSCQGICVLTSTSWTTEPYQSPGYFYLKFTWTRTIYGSNYEDSIRFLFGPVPSEPSTVYANDQDIFEAFSTAPNQQDSWKVGTLTGDALQPNFDLFPNPDWVVFPDPNVPNPVHPPITQQDAERLGWLADGTAQSSDANLPNYVPETDLARLVALAQSLANHAQNLANQHQNKADSPLTSYQYEAISAANNAANLAALTAAFEQPITKAQYDQSNATNMATLTGALPAANFLPDVDLLLNVEKDLIEDNGDLPSGPDFGSLWNLSTGSCNGFSLPITAAGRSFTISANKQCEYYDTFNAGINFFLYLLTAFQIFTIYQRMMTKAG